MLVFLIIHLSLLLLGLTFQQRLRELETPEGEESKSYVHKLLKDPAMLNAKIREEAAELCEATDREHVIQECADVVFFAMVKLRKSGGTFAEVERVLNGRSLKVTRRPGLAKEQFLAEEEKAAEKKVVRRKSLVKKETTNQENDRPANKAPGGRGEGKSLFPAPGAQLRRVDPDTLAVDMDRIAVCPKAVKTAESMFADVKSRGTAALVEYARKFGELSLPFSPSENADMVFSQNLVAGKTEMEKAYLALPQTERETLQRTADRIRSFAEGQRSCLANEFKATTSSTAFGGHTVAPVDVAGCYAPCGSYPLPSSVLMTAVTAKAAGVKKTILATPCGTGDTASRTRQLMLAAAHIANVDTVLLIGGAHAIAALSRGIPSLNVPPANTIVGPGNKYVTAAKSLLAGQVGIDFLAGPSEVAVLCDEFADPDLVARDLLAQAEHDYDAGPVLICTSEKKITQIEECLRQNLLSLQSSLSKSAGQFSDNFDIAKTALNNNGFAVYCPNGLDQATTVANELAPEHLEIMVGGTADSTLCNETAAKCTNYGAIFIGSRSAEVLGDYGAGPNHCLPTGGTAKSFGGLSVFTFLRIRTWLECEDPAREKGFQKVLEDSILLARMEGLECHARAAEGRATSSTVSTSDATTEAPPSTVSSTPMFSKNDGLTPQSNSSSMPNLLAPREEVVDRERSPACGLVPTEIKWGIPKGRMYDNLVQLLKEANLELKVPDRSLRPSVKSMPNWNFKLLKPRSICSMIVQGIRDIAFMGLDLIEEEGYSTVDIVPIINTDLDPVRIVVAVPQNLIDEARKERESGGFMKAPVIMSSLYPEKILDLPQNR